MKDIPIGLQLYSVRDDCAKDFGATLEGVAKLGYAGVEFAGYYGFSAKDLKQRLDDLGLKVAGTHAMLETLTGDELERTIEYNQILGNEFLIVPIEVNRKSRQDWLDLARTLDELAERLAPHGMRTGYHNHFDEFKPIEGEMPWDIVFGNTRLEVVMQIDSGNALKGGALAETFLARYPGRAATVHTKEYTPKNSQALIGEGEVDWAEFFRLCEEVGGTQWYIVEQEEFAYPPMECAKRNLQALEGMIAAR